MALGLGFANPELKRAQLLAQLNGSTALPQGGGGPPPIADSQGGPAAPPVAAQQPQPMPQTTQVPVMRDNGVPQPPDAGASNIDPTGQGAGSVKDAEGKTDWGKVIGGIGYALLAADAGYNGRGIPSPPDYLTDDGSAQQDQDMQVAEFLVNTTARAWEVSRRAPPGAREKMLEQFKGAIQKVAPGFDLDAFLTSMQSDADRADTLAPDIATMSEDAKRMFLSQVDARGGTAEATADVLKDQKFMEGLMNFEDKRNAGAIKYKGAALQAATKKLGANLGELDIDGFLGLNEQLPEQIQLTPSELGTIRRNPSLQALLGLRAPEQPEQPTLESRTGAADRPAPAAPQRPVAPSPPARAGSPTKNHPARSPQTSVPPQAQPPRGRQRPAAAEMPQINPPPPNLSLQAQMKWAADEARRLEAAGADPAKVKQAIDAVRDQNMTDQGRYPGSPGRESLMGMDVTDDKARPRGRQQPAPQQQAKPPARQKPAEGQAQRFDVPKDMELPGIGKVKAGETVIYDPKTQKYRRG